MKLRVGRFGYWVDVYTGFADIRSGKVEAVDIDAGVVLLRVKKDLEVRRLADVYASIEEATAAAGRALNREGK